MLTQYQKKLAEKTYKVRFNGFVSQLRDGKTQVEQDNYPIKWPWSGGYWERGREFRHGINQELVDENLPVAILELLRDAEKLYKGIDAVKEAHAKADKAFRREQELAREAFNKQQAKELEAVASEQNRLVEIAQRRHNKLNARRKEKRVAAKEQRIKTIHALQALRDEGILQIAYQGEGEEMKEILDSMLTATQVTKMLDSKPVKRLSLTTGIGESNPKVLHEG